MIAEGAPNITVSNSVPLAKVSELSTEAEQGNLDHSADITLFLRTF